jgi:hypothetical protein
MESNNNRYTHFFRYASKLLFAFLFVLLTTEVHSQQNLSVIANHEGTPSELSFSELKSVFMGEKQRWGSGKKVVIALMKTRHKIGEEVCDKVYNMKPDQMNKFWLSLVFQGKASAPYFFNTTSELQDFVAQNPGAIGIIEESVNTSDIKTVAINGKKSL